MTTFNHQKAIEDYSHSMRLVDVGAYEERSFEQMSVGTWPEDGVEESLYNLEELAAKEDLEFIGNEQGGYYLAPMSDETREARERAQAYDGNDSDVTQEPTEEDEDMYEQELDRAHQSAENTRLAHLPSVREDEDA